MDIIVYRIAKSIERANDLSGIGAFRNGGRWNSKGTYMLYTSINSSLAYLESLVHFNEVDIPPNLYITAIKINADDTFIYEPSRSRYPKLRKTLDNAANKNIGDRWMAEKKLLAIGVRSAVNPEELNYLLNPLFPSYHQLVTINAVKPLNVDARLIRG